MIIKYLKVAVVLLLLPMLSHAQEHIHTEPPLELLVFKTPTCGCCKKWISHIEEQGITAYSQDYQNLSFIKNKFGINPNLRSCHTAVTKNGFVFEGHVPAKFIRQFLSEEHPNAIGLSVPAMPLGSPGMEVNKQFMPYKVLIMFDDGSSQDYAKVNAYEEQF